MELYGAQSGVTETWLELERADGALDAGCMDIGSGYWELDRMGPDGVAL